jgi:hypothetical protein
MARELAIEGHAVVRKAWLKFTITTGIGLAARPIACGFVCDMGLGVAGISSMVGELTPRQWVFARQCLTSVLAYLKAETATHTVVALVREDFPAAQAFLARLGFPAREGAEAGYLTMTRSVD